MAVLDNIIKIFAGPQNKADQFWELAQGHIKFLYNVAWRYTGNQYDAEDLVQETFYGAFKKFDQLRDRSKLKSWLFTILRNNYLKNLRQNKEGQKATYDDGIEYISALEMSVEQIDAAAAYEQKIEADRLQQLLAGLPEKYQSPIILFYISEMTYQEISEVLDLPIGTVMSRLSRGKRMLKKKILRTQMLDYPPTKVSRFPRKDAKAKD